MIDPAPFHTINGLYLAHGVSLVQDDHFVGRFTACWHCKLRKVLNFVPDCGNPIISCKVKGGSPEALSSKTLFLYSEP